MVKLNLVISCIPLNQGGGGDYLNEIVRGYENYKLIAPFPIGLGNLFIFKLALGLQTIGIRIIITVLSFLKFIDRLVIHHPQSISYKYACMLINSANQIDYWVIDASFFCKKSYNSRNQNSCINCLDGYKPFEDCSHFPRRSTDHYYISFLDAIKRNKDKIKFIVQTQGYKNLVLNKYGHTTEVEKRKMLVGSFYSIKNEESQINLYDFGFHANPIESKGCFYFESLAKKMKEKTFFLPDKSKSRYSEYENLIIKNLRWDSGLKKELQKCKIIVCPSLWTYPVEAAIIKSMLLGKPVGLVEIFSSFSEELPDNAYIKLTGNADIDTATLRYYLLNNAALEDIGRKGKSWALKYINDWN